MLNISMIVWNEFLNDARVLKEAVTLQSEGYQVIVHALHTPGVTEERGVLKSGVKVARIARSPLWRWRKSRVQFSTVTNQSLSGPIKKVSLKIQVLRVISRLWTHAGLLLQMVKSRPDVIHAHDVNTLPTAWLASVITRSRLVYDAHEISTDREGYTSSRKLVGWIEKRLMPKAVATITTTNTRAKFFARAYGIPRPLVLQNRQRFSSAKRTRRIREELGLKEPWPIVLYQGGLQQGRGLEQLVESSVKIPNAYFVFIGGGRIEPLLKERVTALGLEDRVRFIPTVPLADLPFYTASADIGVQPIENTCLNHYSTDSNKLFEYMMAGLPIVASSLPEIRKLVREHGLGLLVSPGNATELTSAIHRLVDNRELRRTFRENALTAAKQVNWEEQEERLVSLYSNMLGRRYNADSCSLLLL